MGLGKYIIKRSITGFITLLLVIAVNFFLFRIPAILFGVDPALMYGIQRLQNQWSQQGRPQEEILREIERLRKQWGIPGPNATFNEWMEAFYNYMGNMLTFNFGESLFTPIRPVLELLVTRLPYTILLLGLSTAFSIIVGVRLGIISAKNYGKKLDQTMMVLTLAIYAVPTFWIQVMCLVIFGRFLKVYPISGGISTYIYRDPLFRLMDLLYLFTLPVFTLVFASYGGWMFLMRNSLSDVLTEDYILTARAKGLDERVVLYKHAMRNAMLPVVTSIILAIAGIWTGAIITETVFNIPGVGSLLLISVLNQNYPLAEMLFYFIAMSTIVANIVADISYALLDPRVKYD